MIKKHSSYRISEDAKLLIKTVARELAISETAVLEISVREKAERMGIKKESIKHLSTAE